MRRRSGPRSQRSKVRSRRSEKDNADSKTETEAEGGEESETEADKDEETSPAPEDETDADETTTAKERKRISIKRGRLSDPDFAIVQLADREKISFKKAEKCLYGEAGKVESGKKAPKESATRTTDPTPESLQQEIEN
jgi:hypothetical protein